MLSERLCFKIYVMRKERITLELKLNAAIVGILFYQLNIKLKFNRIL